MIIRSAGPFFLVYAPTQLVAPRAVRLLYAKTQEEIVPDGQMKRKDGNYIYFRTLDLNTDFGLIKDRLDSFVNK